MFFTRWMLIGMTWLLFFVIWSDLRHVPPKGRFFEIVKIHWKGVLLKKCTVRVYFIRKTKWNTKLIAIAKQKLISLYNSHKFWFAAYRWGRIHIERKKRNTIMLHSVRVGMFPKMHCKGTFFTDKELHCKDPILKSELWAAHAVV